MPAHRLCTIALTAILASSSHCFVVHAALAIQEVVATPDAGLFTLIDDSGSGARGLSGLTYDQTNNRFYAVGDSDSRLFPIDLELDLNTGVIRRGAILKPLQFRTADGLAKTGGDREGVAFNVDNQSVWVASEGEPNATKLPYAPTVTEHRLTDGYQTNSLRLPSVYTSANVNGARRNKSIESLTIGQDGTKWIANEEALKQDGPTSNPLLGTVVRLTRINNDGETTGQFAYQVDTALVVSGVSELLALPGGELVVMERAVNGGTFRIRLYEIDFSKATDIRAIRTLDGSESKVAKKQLWERVFPLQHNEAQTNFEGLTLGPAINDGSGDRCLVLVADNDHSASRTNHNFYALRISGAESSPVK
ncbi:MAG: esterase-like activity of phytase family protein [Planctomycetales bacterium]